MAEITSEITSKTIETKGKQIPENPYKSEQFETFIQLIRGNVIAHWVQIAKALGISKDTITLWKKHPLAQKAIKDGIESTMENMEKAGKDDWKMWESKLKMLGISPIEKSDITSDDNPLPSAIYGGKSKDV